LNFLGAVSVWSESLLTNRPQISEIGVVSYHSFARWKRGIIPSIARARGFIAHFRPSPCHRGRRQSRHARLTTVPIVFATGNDPVTDRFVASLNRPGGNVTGVSFLVATLASKRLDLLRQIAPKATTIAMSALWSAHRESGSTPASPIESCGGRSSMRALHLSECMLPNHGVRPGALPSVQRRARDGTPHGANCRTTWPARIQRASARLRPTY
jgi:hypothetical protein